MVAVMNTNYFGVLRCSKAVLPRTRVTVRRVNQYAMA